DRGDERARVANTDPPHEIDDREAPADGDVDAPDTRAFDDQPADGNGHHPHDTEGDQKSNIPAEGGWAGQDDRADFVGDRPVGIPGTYHRAQPADFGRIEWRLAGAHADSNSG